jgi:hypothetical protein
LEAIWAKVQKDRESSKALVTLEKNGFALSRIPFDAGTWPGIIAGIPLLENNQGRSRSIPVPKGATRVVAQFLREIADGLDAEHSRVEARDEKGTIYTKVGIGIDFPNPRKIADALGKISHCRWAVTNHNPQKNAIASVRWEIIHRTGKPHDVQLFYILRATFKAAGKKFPMSSVLPVAKDVLRKSLDREEATRVAGRRKLGKSPH